MDRNLTDAQLRHLIGEASQILQERRLERTDKPVVENPALPLETGEFVYEVRTSYFPHVKGHFPTFFRLEWHDSGFTPIPLEATVGGKERPSVRGRFPARNGDVFKIVRQNGDYSYQVPLNGALHNLKQNADLSTIGVGQIEPLRPFFENVEPEMFERMTADSHEKLGHAKRWMDESRDRLDRWKRREFWADETPKNKRELREMLADEEQTFRESPTRITECEAFLEWLKGIDRSNPRLEFVVYPLARGNGPRKR